MEETETHAEELVYTSIPERYHRAIDQNTKIGGQRKDDMMGTILHTSKKQVSLDCDGTSKPIMGANWKLGHSSFM